MNLEPTMLKLVPMTEDKSAPARYGAAGFKTCEMTMDLEE